ncbi:MAG: hypothetical protein KAI55_01430 [Candidatus Aenigmarchaeota archaeon]|nr:hypothetical protein [Candidatus Aenigmarchaeota archaeon]
MILKKLKYTLDETLFVCKVLKRLDAGKLNTLDERIKNQKIQYLAQLFKISPVYNFNLYVRGPYSPELTDNLYHVHIMDINIPQGKFVLDELEEKFLKLKKFIEDKNIRELELLTTLHWLIKVADFSKNDAKTKLNELKNPTPKEIKETFNYFEVLCKQIN